MLQEPTDLELAAQIDFLQWIISKRREGDEYKRKLEVQLFCIRAVCGIRAQDLRLEKAVEILRRRAAGYQNRAAAIFNGRVMAEELRANAREIEALSKEGK